DSQERKLWLHTPVPHLGSRPRHWLRVALVAVLFALTVSIPTVDAAGDPVLVGAGDIADCTVSSDSQTAALIESIPGTVITLGDNAYPFGSAANYRDCYDPTW